MKKVLNKVVLGAALMLAIPAAMAQWKTLSVPLVTQEHSQWCWSASSKAVLNYYAKTQSQCQIVNWAFGPELRLWKYHIRLEQLCESAQQHVWHQWQRANHSQCVGRVEWRVQQRLFMGQRGERH
ncbi:hypothetical protein [Massilia sp. TSP1-1-2]|uniref:hypothetical protein n=1 Tax=unclassified Massilia TaxID=2609279 RepID=UPI003CF00D88